MSEQETGHGAATEPAHFERDDVTGVVHRLDGVKAATEPAHFERDDSPRAWTNCRNRWAATEPAHFERDDAFRCPVRAGRRRLAATEPAHFERDDFAVAGVAVTTRPKPQRSPLILSGMTRSEDFPVMVITSPQRSPLILSGMTATTYAPRRASARRRNGARSF